MSHGISPFAVLGGEPRNPIYKKMAVCIYLSMCPMEKVRQDMQTQPKISEQKGGGGRQDEKARPISFAN